VQHAQLLLGEWRLGQHKGRDVFGARDEQMRAGVFEAGIQKRGRRQADHASGLVHVAGAVPAAYREYAIVVDGLEEGAPALHGVEAVLAQAEGARARRRPGVDHTHLHEIELFLGAREPAAGVIDVQLQIRQRRQIGKAPVKGIERVQIYEDGIEFHAGDVRHAEQMGRQKVATAADANDRGLADAWKTVGQIDQIVLEERNGVAGAVKVEHGGGRIAVDIEPHLRDVRVRRQVGRGTPHLGALYLRAPRDDAGIGIPPLVNTEARPLDIIFDQDRPDADRYQ
jgi:hypothetical protein